MTGDFEVSYIDSSGRAWPLQSRELGLAAYSEDAYGWDWSSDDGRDMGVTLAALDGGALAALDAALAAAESDRDAGTPGLLSVLVPGGQSPWRTRCTVSKGDPAWLAGAAAAWSATLHQETGDWTRETTTEFLPYSATGSDHGGADLPTDLPLDLGASGSSSYLDVPGPLPCDLRITWYGRAANPSVWIGGNLYRVGVTVPDGGLLTVDTTRRKSMAGDAVVLRDRYGVETDAYRYRERGSEGSGSYIFERLRPGRLSVSWPQSYGLDVTVIERMGRLPWS